MVVLLGIQATGILPEFRNPFAKEQTDRSQPPLLKSIQDLSRYVAAEGNFQVVVDTQNDRRNVPDFLLNERTLFVGAGSVEAYVDFTKIAEGAVVQSADGKSVEIKLPAPQLGETNLDMEKSYVFAEQRGLLNRLGDLVGNDPNRQQQVYQLAEERITAAARDSGLSARAEENTRKMLEGLLRSLGYQQITVTYIAPDLRPYAEAPAPTSVGAGALRLALDSSAARPFALGAVWAATHPRPCCTSLRWP